jgi:uncharacterized protein
MFDLSKITGFDWDDGNARKNEKHNVMMQESEQVFFNQPLLIVDDAKHSAKEARYHALGKSNEKRLLHITFTLRENDTKLRIISARPMSKREEKFYVQDA